jgi:DNA-binding response OmpR family regulator
MATGLSVLLIDDEEDFIRTLASRLELRGMRPRVAFSGMQGLEELEKETPDVVLLDMRMPTLSGLDVLRRIRAHRPDLPVMIITGHCSEQDRDQALELGVQGYYSKPVSFDELLGSLRLLQDTSEGGLPYISSDSLASSGR